MGEVVAGGDGQTGLMLGAPRRQAFDQQGSQRWGVAFFGHRERDPARCRRGQRADHLGPFVGCQAGAPDRAADLPRRPGAAGGLHRIEPVLRIQPADQRRAAHGHAQHAPAGVAALQQAIKHQGLVRPVKRAQTQMDDTDSAASRVMRPLDILRQQGQSLQVQTHGVFKLENQ